MREVILASCILFSFMSCKQVDGNGSIYTRFILLMDHHHALDWDIVLLLWVGKLFSLVD